MVIDKGHYGNVDLAGVKWGIGGAFGRSARGGEQEYDFIAYYIDESATAEQKSALKSIFASKAFEPMGAAKEVKEMAITFSGMDDFGMAGKTYSGSIGSIAKVEITPVSGAMKDKPIVVENSAEPLFYWTALGKTSGSYFKGAGMDWTFNGTSGESHRFRVESSGETGGHEHH
jgi:hypothetical protein